MCFQAALSLSYFSWGNLCFDTYCCISSMQMFSTSAHASAISNKHYLVPFWANIFFPILCSISQPYITTTLDYFSLLVHFKCRILFSLLCTLFGDAFADTAFFISFTRRGMKNTSSICRELLDLSSSSWTFVRPSLPSLGFYSALFLIRAANN